MTLTNEQFKARVAEIFADGAQITDTKFDELSDAITQLEQPTTGGGGDLTVKIAEKYKNLNTELETRLQTTVTKTETGQTLEIGVGPWFNILLREIYGNFPKAQTLVSMANTTYTMPESYIVSSGPSHGSYFDNVQGKIIKTSKMAWRIFLNGARVVYALNWNKASTVEVFDLGKGTRNLYNLETTNTQLPEELKNEGCLSGFDVYGDAWEVGRFTESNKNTFIVESVNSVTGESLKAVYQFSITEHSSGVKFNDEGKFKIGYVFNITSATFIEEYINPLNVKTFKRRITTMR